MPSFVPQDLVGKTLGRFEVLSVLGAGGMGVVLLASDPQLGRRVALKILPEEASESARQLFLREARAAAAVTHPNIATLYEVGEDAGRAFIAMELVEGIPLRTLIERPLPVPQARAMALQIARGLSCAHRAGVVHRDLKPDNVMVAADGTAKLLDFGLAKVQRPKAPDADGLADTVPRAHTAEGTIMGTPGYLAPEQAQGLPADARADVFSFGVLLYELLTGKRAFPSRTTMEGIVAVCRDEPPSVSSLNPAIPFALQALVASCLAKDPEKRPRDGAALVAALEAIDPATTSAPVALDVTVASKKAPPVGPKTSRRAVAAALAAAVVLAGAAAVLAWRPWETSSTPPVPKYGGVLRVGSMREASKQRLYLGSVRLSELVQESVAEPLFTQAPGVVSPVSWEERDAGRTVALRLAGGVRFHRHPCTPEGREATLEDLAYSVELGVSALGDLPVATGGLEVSGGELLVRLKGPVPFLAEWLAKVPLAPRELAGCEDPADLSLLPGVGPFQAENTGSPDRLAASRFPTGRWRDAQGRDLPFVDKVELEHDAEPLRLMGRVVAGSLDVAVLDLEGSQPFVEQAADGTWRLKPEWARPGLSVAANVVPSISSIYFLQVLPREGGPLRDDALRKALARGIDRAALARALEPRKVVPTGRLLHSRQRGFDTSVQDLRFEPSGLSELLEARGGAVPELVIGSSASSRSVAPAVVERLNQAGLKVRGEELLATSLDGIRNAGYDAALLSVNTTDVRGEPWNLMQVAHLAQRRFQQVPALEEAFDQLRGERDRAVRERLYATLERGLLEQAVMIPLLRMPADSPRVAHSFYVYRDRVHGLADPVTHLLLHGDGHLQSLPLTGAWLDPQ